MDQRDIEEQARAARNAAIAATDYLELKDAPITPLGRIKLELYRKQLRDWPGTSGFPDVGTMPQPDDWSLYKPAGDATSAEIMEVS